MNELRAVYCVGCGGYFTHRCFGKVKFRGVRPSEHQPPRVTRWMKIPRIPYGYNPKHPLWAARRRGEKAYRIRDGKWEFRGRTNQ